MAPWNVDKAKELYGVSTWGRGYFDINEKGNVVVAKLTFPEQKVAVGKPSERTFAIFVGAKDLDALFASIPDNCRRTTVRGVESVRRQPSHAARASDSSITLIVLW